MENNIPKWQQEVEAILRERYQGDELLERVQKANELLNLSQEIEPPSGDIGEVTALMLRWASEELSPLAIAYLGFQLGVAYERSQNANRT